MPRKRWRFSDSWTTVREVVVEAETQEEAEELLYDSSKWISEDEDTEDGSYTPWELIETLPSEEEQAVPTHRTVAEHGTNKEEYAMSGWYGSGQGDIRMTKEVAMS